MTWTRRLTPSSSRRTSWYRLSIACRGGTGHEDEDEEAVVALAEGDEVEDDEEGEPIDEYDEEGYAPL
jgi:hypothetical protein